MSEWVSLKYYEIGVGWLVTTWLVPEILGTLRLFRNRDDVDVGVVAMDVEAMDVEAMDVEAMDVEQRDSLGGMDVEAMDVEQRDSLGGIVPKSEPPVGEFPLLHE